MSDRLNKQTLINLLIDSPLREPIKINLIDIVNNTSDPDLPKIFPTIVKELEIFQKATERRMKLADETIAKLGGTTPSDSPAPTTPTPPTNLPTPPTEPTLPPAPLSQATNLPPLSVPPLDLPPLPTVPTPPTPSPVESPVPPMPAVPTPPTPPVPSMTPSTLPPLQSLGTTPATNGVSSDEDALAEIQKELESLKSGIATDATPAPTPVTPQI